MLGCELAPLQDQLVTDTKVCISRLTLKSDHMATTPE